MKKQIAENKQVSQKIFFDGQIYDAFSLLASIVRKAEKSIILVDNYVDTVSLDILSKRKDAGNKAFGVNRIEDEKVITDILVRLGVE